MVDLMQRLCFTFLASVILESLAFERSLAMEHGIAIAVPYLIRYWYFRSIGKITTILVSAVLAVLIVDFLDP